MTAFIFIGPTLSRQDALKELDAVYLPPAAQGDIYLAALKEPRAIGLIDGYFQGVPSVWHKEILWAMTQGIHVFGSASMGALRAAELEPFGMVGIGRIFESYRTGLFAPFNNEPFEDDDEVAVSHGPAEAGYVTLCEAMVNIRRTLADAESQGIIGTDTRNTLARIAKDLVYQSRSYDELLSRADCHTLPQGELDRLRDWLRQGKVDQKRNDAIAMLGAMREFLADGPEKKRVNFDFQHTSAWENVTAFSRRTRAASGGDLESLILDELRLEGQAYEAIRRAALLRMIALGEASRQDLMVTVGEKRQVTTALRERFGMFRRKDIEAWLSENHLQINEFDRLMEDEARLKKLGYLAQATLGRHMLDHLRMSGDYARLAARASAKQKFLEPAQVHEYDPDGPTLLSLLAWYFEQHLGRDMPDDLEEFVANLDFADETSFGRTLLREYQYVKGGPAQREP